MGALRIAARVAGFCALLAATYWTLPYAAWVVIVLCVATGIIE